MNGRCLKPIEVSKMLNLGVTSLHHMVDRGVLPGFRIARQLRFREEAIEQFIAEQEAKVRRPQEPQE